MDYQQHVLPLALALTSAALAWKLMSLSSGQSPQRHPPGRATLPVFTNLKKAIRAYLTSGRFSPILKHRSSVASFRSEVVTKASRDSLDDRSLMSLSRNSPPSVSPLKLKRPCSALSVDLSEASRSTSSLRVETERVNRMSSYCQSLERKAEWLEAREYRESKHRKELTEEVEELKRKQRLEEEFRRRTESEWKRKKDEERKQKQFELIQKKAILRDSKVRQSLQTRDELSRSAAKASLSSFTKQRRAEIARQERSERMQDRKEFVSAVKTAKQREDVNYVQSLHQDLTFQLRQAVTRNQEIVKRIMGTGYLEV